VAGIIENVYSKFKQMLVNKDDRSKVIRLKKKFQFYSVRGTCCLS
jgi:hypothetical protein